MCLQPQQKGSHGRIKDIELLNRSKNSEAKSTKIVLIRQRQHVSA